jgi:hypothetical protein
MKVLLKLFPAGHFVIALLFVCASIGLIVLAALQLWQGLQPFAGTDIIERLHALLESIAILTVALAALELGQTILEEEVVREAHMSAPTRVRRFLSRFMIVLTVALTIETLVLTFRFGAEAPENLPYVAMIGLAAAVLLAAWGLFVHLNRSAEELEPEAMQQAKREDRKIDKGDKR